MVIYSPTEKQHSQLNIWLILILTIQLNIILEPVLNGQGENPTPQNLSLEQSKSEPAILTTPPFNSERSVATQKNTTRPDIIAHKRDQVSSPTKTPNRINEVVAMSTKQLLETQQFFPVYGSFTELGQIESASLPVDLVADPVTRFSSIAFARPINEASRYIVTLDPGHGGTDPGAIGTYGELEKFLTLDITKRVARLLETSPLVSVKTTRYDDTGYSRIGRVNKIRSQKSDLLVSLHFNHLPQSELTLVETFYAGPENILESLLSENQDFQQKKVNLPADSMSLSYTKHSQTIATILQDRIYNVVSRNNTSAIDAGVKKDTLFILTQSQTPGALIELTCLSNSEEEKRLQTTAYRQELASAIAGGLLDYFIEYERATGI